MTSEQSAEHVQASERTPLLNDERHDVEDEPQSQANGQANGQAQQQQEAGLAELEEWSTTRLTITLGSCYIGVFLAALDTTITATLAAPISDSFQSFTAISWLASAYLIANAGFQPISGKLSDIYGRRPCLIIAMIFFGAGNLVCGLAESETTIILGRAISGIGGGCINTIGTFIASDLVPLKQRGLWQGLGNISFGLGSALGGVFGGFMLKALDWRWAFLIQIPFTAVAALIIFFTVKIPTKESDRSKIKRVDFLGAFTLVSALVLLLLGLNSGGNNVPWNHPLIYVSLPVSGILLVLFIYIEDKVAEEPVIPVRLLLHRTIASGCLTNWTLTMSYFIYVYYGPIYFLIRGLDSEQVGFRLIANAVGLAIGSFGAGLIMRKTGKYYWLNVVVQVDFIIAMALMLGLFTLYTPLWIPFIPLALGGLGYGAMLTVTLIALISAVPHKFQAVITSASYAARSTGSTIGMAIASAVFQNVLTRCLWKFCSGDPNADEMMRMLRNNIEGLQDLPEPLRSKALSAYIEALQGVWTTMLCIAVVGAIASLFMREHTLHSNLARK